MFGNGRPFSYDSNDYRGSPQSYGLPMEPPSSQRSSMSRPSGKSIYMQRKEYSESMNRQPDNFQYRVEHLFTCEMDGHEVRSLDDCIARLKTLDAKGRVWGQEMILEVRGGSLQMSDIETKGELETLALGLITQTQAVLDSGVYNSLLTVTVEERRGSKVFMFQCEEVGAEHIKDDLDKVIQHRKEDRGDPYRGDQHNIRLSPTMRDQHNIRENLEHIIGQRVSGSSQKNVPPFVQPDQFRPPPEFPPPQWPNPEYAEPQYIPVPPQPRNDPPKPQYTNTQRNVEVLNHVLSDTELFMGQVSAALSRENKKKKSMNKKDIAIMPPLDEFAIFLEKIKYGFNLLGKLNGIIQSPSAPDFIHVLFSALSFVLPHCPQNLPPSIIVPLLTEPALRLMAQEVTPEEDRSWVSLGDSWNIPRSKWPGSDQLPLYIPSFCNGWQPPPPILPPPENKPLSRTQSLYKPLSRSQSLPNKFPSHMRVIYDFMARNSQELTVMKEEVVQVLDPSKQWWKVCNSRNEEGYVPQNVLEPLDGGRPQQEQRTPPPLSETSPHTDVKAWLELKGFSKITVRTLGVLTGALILGMSHDELRAVCPEEGGRVFFQLQAVRSALALASESGYGHFNGR